MLRVRWLGRVSYREADAVQHALAERSGEWLLLLEHDHVFTLGVRADPAHILVDAAAVGADVVAVDRGGDVTYHGPGQLVGYPIVDVPLGREAIPAHVHRVEQILIDALVDLGLPGAGRLAGYPGVWVGLGDRPRKIAAIGVKVTRGRSLHGFALNVAPDLTWFTRIVPCGIRDYPVTSLAAEGISVGLEEAARAVAARAGLVWGGASGVEEQAAARPVGQAPPQAATGAVRRADGSGCAEAPSQVPAPVASEPPVGRPEEAALLARPLGRRLQAAGVDPSVAVRLRDRKPTWLRPKAHLGADYRELKQMFRELGLVTVCEEAGCPNIFECWAERTATFMINGERCTRACGFCLVDTRHPNPLDGDEPARVAEAVARLGLAHAVVTAVARDDLDDGGAGAFAATIGAIRERCPTTTVEVLVPDFRGRSDALAVVLEARPDVLNHNLETVLRLQRAVRPQAGYARSLAVLARAKAAGLTTKSGLMVGLGETAEEVRGALADLAGVGCDIVTIGQYLRPSAAHLPVLRWWPPEELESLGAYARSLGFADVEASPLARSSYHARRAAEAAGAGTRVGGPAELAAVGGRPAHRR